MRPIDGIRDIALAAPVADKRACLTALRKCVSVRRAKLGCVYQTDVCWNMGRDRHAVREPKSQGNRANGMRDVIEFVESGWVGISAYANRSRSRAAVPSMRSGVS